MVEFRRTLNDWIMIEANPRLWGPSQLILDSGMDLFDMFLYDNDLIWYMEDRKYKPDVPYLWSSGMGMSDSKLDDYQPDIFLTDDLYNKSDTIKIFNNG